MKVYLDTIGCRLNQAEIESMARQFRAAGHEIVASAEMADVAVVNTCAVTSAAASDSRGVIRRMARAGVQQIIPTGCWATLRPQEAAALPNVWRVVANDRKDQLVLEILDPQKNASAAFRHPQGHSPGQVFHMPPVARQPLPGLRPRTRSFIKVQDGCNNRCTFCLTTIARGQGRSRGMADVIQDIRSALKGGAKEVVLTGVHLGSWGQEFGLQLRDLVKTVLRETDLPRLRLSSLEPWDLDTEFFFLWEDPRLMPHLHLPLQSGCAATLKRMARKTTPASFRELVSAARDIIPKAAITTDVIAGFPGETEAEFTESLDFVREINFAGGHVFTYSPRPGTAAARMSGQVRPEVRKERNRLLRQALQESANAYRRKVVGLRQPVLWESASGMGERGWQLEGLTGNYLRVKAFAASLRWNEIDVVELTAVEADGDGLKGVIIKSG